MTFTREKMAILTGVTSTDASKARCAVELLKVFAGMTLAMSIVPQYLYSTSLKDPLSEKVSCIDGWKCTECCSNFIELDKDQS